MAHQSEVVTTLSDELARYVEGWGATTQVKLSALNIASVVLDGKPMARASECRRLEPVLDNAKKLGFFVSSNALRNSALIARTSGLIDTFSDIEYDGHFESFSPEELTYYKTVAEKVGMDFEEIQSTKDHYAFQNLIDLGNELEIPFSDKMPEPLSRKQNRILGETFGYPPADINYFLEFYESGNSSPLPQSEYPALTHRIPSHNHVDDCLNTMRTEKIWEVSPKLAAILDLSPIDSELMAAKQKFGDYLAELVFTNQNNSNARGELASLAATGLVSNQLAVCSYEVLDDLSEFELLATNIPKKQAIIQKPEQYSTCILSPELSNYAAQFKVNLENRAFFHYSPKFAKAIGVDTE